MVQKVKTDVAVTGAGPAGLMASIACSKAGLKTSIIDSNTVAGRKLLHTGRTRCNLTHTGSVQDFISSYGPFGRFLRPSLYDFSSEDLRNYFAARNLETKAEKDGCVFPVTDRAGDVVRVLVDDARRLSVRFFYGRTVRSITKEGSVFVLTTDRERIEADSVIIATGGVSWPFTGSRGDGYGFARYFGHSIVAPRPCLVRVVTAETWPGELSGVGVENVIITARIGKRRIHSSGPMIFTDNGIGGPAVFDLSRLITDFLPGESEPIKINVDMLGQYQLQELDKEIISLCAANPHKELAGVLARLLARRLMLKITTRLGPTTILAGQLTKQQRKEMVNMLKSLPLSVRATADIAEATVTRGGVSTEEIEPKTMESKLCPGLYFAGEVMNVDGPCGGFNLQIAFSTGRLAGKMAAEKLTTEKPQK